VADRRLRGRLAGAEARAEAAAREAGRAAVWLQAEEPGALEPEGPLEATWRVRQGEIAAAAGGAGKSVELDLAKKAGGRLGPYRVGLSHEGRYLLHAGRKGHLGVYDWQRGVRRPVCEVQVRETVRDACFLHNAVYFAAAQRQDTFIYDKRGLELHRCPDLGRVSRLDFLRRHFILCGVGEQGVLSFLDTTTGQLVAQHRTKLGPCDVMRQNPWNAVQCLGHGNGTVTMWSPNVTQPLVKMLCHKGPVRALAADRMGRHLVTAGADGQVKVWDVRTFKPLHQYFSSAPAVALDVSQRGMLAVGWGRRVQVWQGALSRKAKAPYLNHSFDEGCTLGGFAFCPYEDVLVAGHARGVSSMLVPGAGEPNYDSYVANPFQTRKERREAEVHNLLDKLQPETIVIDPERIGMVRRDTAEAADERRSEAQAANDAALRSQRAKNAEKSRKKGKNKASRRHRKKQVNVIVDRRDETARKLKESGQRLAEKRRAEVPEGLPKALERFY